jgi:hypothetical protein
MDKENKFIDFFKKFADTESSIKRTPTYFLVICVLLVVLIVKIDKTNNFLQQIAENGTNKLEVETYDETFIEIITEESKDETDYVPMLEASTNITSPNSSNNSEKESTTKHTYESTTSTTTVQNTDNTTRKSYVLNTSSKKIHLPSCSFVSRTKEENKKTVNLSEDEFQQYHNNGYTMCKTCGGI